MKLVKLRELQLVDMKIAVVPIVVASMQLFNQNDIETIGSTSDRKIFRLKIDTKS